MRSNYLQSRPRGYIALITALIIAALLTTTVFISSARIFFSRSAQQDYGNKSIAEILARSCALVALSAIKSDPTFSPKNERVTVTPDESCTIDSLTATPGSVKVLTSAHIGHSYSAYDTTASGAYSQAQFSSISSKEITSIPP